MPAWKPVVFDPPKRLPTPPRGMSRHHITDPLYKQSFELLIGGTESALIAYVRQRTGATNYKADGPTGCEARVTIFQATDGERWISMWIRQWNGGTPEDWARLAHEAYHLMVQTMERVGVSDEEASAYYLGWIIGEVGTRLRRRR